MTAAAPVRPCPPPTARSCAVLARYYTTEFAWPTAADAAGVWLRLGDVVDALIIWAALAAKVNARLVQSLLGAPIIEVSGGNWIFLTQRRTPASPVHMGSSGPDPVGWSEPGSSLRLPRADELTCDVRWLRRPVLGAPLPPGSP